MRVVSCGLPAGKEGRQGRQGKEGFLALILSYLTNSKIDIHTPDRQAGMDMLRSEERFRRVILKRFDIYPVLT